MPVEAGLRDAVIAVATRPRYRPSVARAFIGVTQADHESMKARAEARAFMRETT
jgi:hypothetical protein